MKRNPGRLMILICGAAIAAAVLLWAADIQHLLDLGAAIAESPLLTAATVLMMALMMSFGLPGSLCFWLIAPFHPLGLGISLLLAGSTSGALGAYLLGNRLGEGWHPSRPGRQILGLLRRRSDLLTQCAMRVLPGFPHAFINLAAGVLHLPLITFCCAAFAGLAVKWGLYVYAVQGLVDASQAEQALSITTLFPLIALAALMAAGALARQRWVGANTPGNSR